MEQRRRGRGRYRCNSSRFAVVRFLRRDQLRTKEAADGLRNDTPRVRGACCRQAGARRRQQDLALYRAHRSARPRPDLDAAKRLIAEAGYKGEKIVVLDRVDLPTSHAHGLIAADLLKRLGFNVELATSDWGTVVARRASKKRVAEGGWNVFGTDFLGAEMLNPPLPANGDKAWFGWPKDDKIEALRNEWLQAGDSETRQEIASKVQERAFETVPYIPTGQYLPKTAYRKTLKGIINAPALFMWNVEKV
jgi:peptide/nickel transport system substrate-binding protein